MFVQLLFLIRLGAGDFLREKRNKTKNEVSTTQHRIVETVQHRIAETVQHRIAETVQHRIAETVQHRMAEIDYSFSNYQEPGTSYCSVFSLVFASIEKIYQTLDTVEFRQIYSAARRIFNSLLGVWISR